MGLLFLKSRRRLGGKSEEECAHALMVPKHLANYLTALVTVRSDSLPSIMAVSSSSFPCLLLLLISSLSWASNRGSAFLMERGGTTSSGRSPPSGPRAGTDPSPPIPVLIKH